MESGYHIRPAAALSALTSRGLGAAPGACYRGYCFGFTPRATSDFYATGSETGFPPVQLSHIEFSQATIIRCTKLDLVEIGTESCTELRGRLPREVRRLQTSCQVPVGANVW
jgi:hypothetical protein